jgi:hypothetical protein
MNTVSSSDHPLGSNLRRKWLFTLHVRKEMAGNRHPKREVIRTRKKRLLLDIVQIGGEGHYGPF